MVPPSISNVEPLLKSSIHFSAFSISENEFKHIMLSLGEKISEEELEEMMKKADPKNQGYVNYKEFAKILLS